MKRKLLVCVLLMTALSLTGCTNKTLEAAKESVSSYNDAAESYNELIKPYNDAVAEIEAANTSLQEAIDNAQTALNAGETPFDETTEDALNEALTAGANAKVAVPEVLPEYDEMTVDEEAKNADLKALTSEADSELAEVTALVVPDVPTVPDYSTVIANINDTLSAYQDSVTSLKQITAPSDDFVIERLQQISTIKEIQAVTEDHDPNGNLGKQGGYIGSIYFSDTRVDRDKLYIEDGDDTVDIGNDGGGNVEIYANVEDAETRNAYLSAFDGTGISVGSHYVYGTCVVRTSDELKASEQKSLTEEIVSALTEVKK